jgi:MEMO1 family protein
MLRRAAFAGSWYPRTPDALAAEVDRHLEAVAAASAPGRLVALVSPHAGLHYSGPVAAHAYALLRARSELTVVLVGPAHRASFEGVALHARGEWQTPLGSVAIDQELAEALLAAGGEVFDDAGPHRNEHSLEMQLPFLQRVVSGLRIVPLLMGTQSRTEVDALAGALAAALESRASGREVVLLASSDLSHYQPAPVAGRLDAEVVEDVRRLDAEALMRRLETRDNVACGGGPIVAVLKAARALGAERGSVLRYADSGDAGEHDKTHVVGYLAAALSAGP